MAVMRMAISTPATGQLMAPSLARRPASSPAGSQQQVP